MYKYKGLAAENMTDIVYARAVVVDKDNKATAYSHVLDYSVVEYVHTAKGAFNNGTPVIANEDVFELLDSVLDFGAKYGTSGQWYHSIRTVKDPDDPDNYVFHITSSNSATMSISSHLSSNGKAFYGYGDTLDESITFEMEIGKPNPNANVSINGIFLRDRSAWGGWAENEPYNDTSGTAKYTSGNLFSYVVRVLDNDVILPGNNAKICTLPDTGLVTVNVSVYSFMLI